MKWLIAVVLVLASLWVMAQISIDIPGISVHTGAGSKTSSSGNTVANEKGVIGPDADIEGVTIINDELYIDGVKIARGTTEYKAKKSKKTYSIRWGKKGEGVTVTEKP